MRHKRTRYLFWLPLLFVFYGLLIYPSGEYNKDTLLGNYFLLIVGALITGFFILSFAILIFSLESRYFCFIITNKIDLLTYLRAKYYLMIALSLVLYLISLFYVFYGIKIIIINSVMLLFNSGFTSFLLMYLATFNKIKFDLNAGMNSWQGKGGNQFLAGFSLFLIVFLIFLPFGLLKNSTAGFIVFGIIGLLGLIFHNKILQMLIIQFTKRKYIMSEGFRQT